MEELTYAHMLHIVWNINSSMPNFTPIGATCRPNAKNEKV